MQDAFFNFSAHSFQTAKHHSLISSPQFRSQALENCSCVNTAEFFSSADFYGNPWGPESPPDLHLKLRFFSGFTRVEWKKRIDFSRRRDRQVKEILTSRHHFKLWLFLQSTDRKLRRHLHFLERIRWSRCDVEDDSLLEREKAGDTLDATASRVSKLSKGHVIKRGIKKINIDRCWRLKRAKEVVTLGKAQNMN